MHVSAGRLEAVKGLVIRSLVKRDTVNPSFIRQSYQTLVEGLRYVGNKFITTYGDLLEGLRTVGKNTGAFTVIDGVGSVFLGVMLFSYGVIGLIWGTDLLHQLWHYLSDKPQTHTDESSE